MACNIERPEPQELFDRYKDKFSNTVLGGGTVIPESNEWYAVALNYAMAEEFYAIAEQAWKEQDPRQACADNLVEMAALDGVYPQPAVPAQGYVKLTGTAGSALPTPLEFTAGGVNFVTSSNTGQPTQISDDGTAIVRVRALTPGANGNVSTEVGSMVTAVAGVSQEVEICGGSFCEGEDAETTESFRQRYLKRLQYQPRATLQWMQEKLLEWPCATRVILRQGNCCSSGCEQAPQMGSAVSEECRDCGCVDCGGKMHFYVLFDSSFPNGIAPQSVLTEIEDWMFGSPQGYGLGQAEVGVCGRIASVTGVPVNVFIDIADCPTSTDLTTAQQVTQEFFQTVEPSVQVNGNDLAASISRVLGGADVDVRFELVNPDHGYGAGIPASDGRVVYRTGCALEPDCDYMLTLNQINITSASSARTGCP
jgi:hypothetical protein